VALRHAGALWGLPDPAVVVNPESTPNTIGRITLDAKRAGKRSAGNPHAAFDEAGTGNGATPATAPVPDPTERGALGNQRPYRDHLSKNLEELSGHAGENARKVLDLGDAAAY
jgi:hypothetical protein